MRVLHIIWSSNIGGIESVVLNLAIAQKNNSLVSPAIFAAKSEGPLIEKAENKNIKIIKGHFNKGSFNIKMLNECLNVFKQYDILHLHSFNPIIALAAIRSKRKIVFTEHGNFAFERNQGLFEKLSKKLQQYFLNNFVNYITFNSSFSQNTACNKYQIRNKSTRVIYNGVDIPPIINDHILNSNIIQIGFVGRLVEVKRVDRLMEALAAIKDKSKIKVELIGDGPQKANIEKLIADNDLNSTVHLLGYRNDVSNYYNQWDLLIAPSSNEAFGLVAIEAYSYGCAVAVFKDGGGLAELVQKCEPNMVFKTTNSLTTFIESLILRKETINETKQRNHRKAFAQEFSIQKMELAINEVYLSL